MPRIETFGNFVRQRIRPTAKCIKGSFRTIRAPGAAGRMGVKIVVCCPRGRKWNGRICKGGPRGGGLKAQTRLFPKTKFRKSGNRVVRKPKPVFS